MPTKDLQKPSADEPVEKEEQRFSTQGTNILNSLLRTFHAASGTTSPLPRSTEFIAPPTLHELEVQLQCFARVMELLSMSQDIKKEKTRKAEINSRYGKCKGDSKRRDFSRTNTITTATGTRGSSKSAAKLALDNYPKAVQAETFSDYGEDSDLDQIFHSFFA